jgi:AcrR family transcriptional regulator
MSDLVTADPSSSTSTRRERQPADIRRKAILAAATDVFLERGYADTSIDAVVERAGGGSKATIYAMFGNKEGLFSAVVGECADEFTAALGNVPICTSPRDSMRRIAHAYLRVALHPKRIAMFRMVAGDSGRRPEVGDIFYRMALRSILTQVANFIRGCATSRLIEIPDAEQLADQFLAALRGSLFLRVLLNPTRAPTDKELERHVNSVVDVFLRGACTGGGCAEAPAVTPEN